VTEEYGVAVLL